MKKITLIAAAIAFALAGCEKKPEPPKAPEAPKKVEAPKAEEKKADEPKK